MSKRAEALEIAKEPELRRIEVDGYTVVPIELNGSLLNLRYGGLLEIMPTIQYLEKAPGKIRKPAPHLMAVNFGHKIKWENVFYFMREHSLESAALRAFMAACISIPKLYTELPNIILPAPHKKRGRSEIVPAFRPFYIEKGVQDGYMFWPELTEFLFPSCTFFLMSPLSQTPFTSLKA